MDILRKFQMLIRCHLYQPCPMILKSESDVNSSSATWEASAHIQPAITWSAASWSCWEWWCFYIPTIWPDLCAFAKPFLVRRKPSIWKSCSPNPTTAFALITWNRTKNKGICWLVSGPFQSPGIWAEDVAQSMESLHSMPRTLDSIPRTMYTGLDGIHLYSQYLAGRSRRIKNSRLSSATQ